MTPAKDKAAALQLVNAALQGDLAAVAARYGRGENIGCAKEDVTLAPALDLGKAALDTFRLLNLHGADETLNAALYLAAGQGHETVVKFFLAAGAFDQRSLDVALFGAVQAGRLDLVKTLESAGANTGFNDFCCLAESITAGHDDIAAHLITAGAGWNTAMVAYIETGRLDKAFDAIGEEIRPADGLQAIIRMLSGRRAFRGERTAHDKATVHLDLFDNLLSYAEGLGADMPALLQSTAGYALEQAAPAALSRLLAHPAGLPRATLDAGMEMLATPAALGAPMGRETLDALFTALLEKGASPQAALESAVATCDPARAAEALDKGADPRRDGARALKAAGANMLSGSGKSQPLDDRIATYTRLKHAAGMLDEQDYAAFAAAFPGPVTCADLRQTPKAGARSGLMLAIAAGKAAEALPLFEDRGLTRAELVHTAADGESALSLLIHREEAHLLFNRRLWSLNEQDYAAVFAALPPRQQEKLAAPHQEIAEALAADRANWQLRQLRDRNRQRFRPQ